MAAKAGLTKSANIIPVREADFVSRFANNWQDLMDALGATRMIPKVSGTDIKYKYAEVTLENGAVGEGEEIPYSQAQVKTKTYAPIVIEKYKKGEFGRKTGKGWYDYS